MTSPRSATWSVLLAASFLLTVEPVAAKKKYRPYRVAPGVGSTALTDGLQTVTVSREGLNSEVAYTTSAVRRRMMRATLGMDIDPFGTPPGEPLKFHVFLVSLENNSEREMLFNPSTSRIYTDKDDFEYGMDFSELYSGLGRLYGLDLEQIHMIAYDQSVTIEPGGKVRKLLAFHEIDRKWDQFYLLMTLESTGLGTVDLSVPFNKIYLDEEMQP